MFRTFPFIGGPLFVSATHEGHRDLLQPPYRLEMGDRDFFTDADIPILDIIFFRYRCWIFIFFRYRYQYRYRYRYLAWKRLFLINFFWQFFLNFVFSCRKSIIFLFCWKNIMDFRQLKKIGFFFLSFAILFRKKWKSLMFSQVFTGIGIGIVSVFFTDTDTEHLYNFIVTHLSLVG